MVINTCAHCWKQFKAKSKKFKYCSKLCKNQFRYQKEKTKKSFIKKCEHCWKTFTTPNKNVKVCSLECRWRIAAIKWKDKRIENTDYEKALDRRKATREKNWWHPMQREWWVEKMKATYKARTWYETAAQNPEAKAKQIASRKKRSETEWFWECICEVCWCKFIKRTTWIQKYCSRWCMLASLNLKRRKEPIYIECIVCWKEFKTSHPNQLYCSEDCKRVVINEKVKQKRRIEHPLQIKVCECCWKEFESSRSDTKYCSEKCYKYTHYRIVRKKSNCIDCWKEITLWRTRCKSCSFKRTRKENYETMYDNIVKNSSKVWYITKAEKKWQDFIESNTWEKVDNQFIIQWFDEEWNHKSYRFDLKVWNILIDVNPTWSHNSTFFPKWEAKSERYHQVKSLSAEKLWYHPIHIFDWDDNDVVKNRLIWLIKWRKRLYHWEVLKISSKQAAEFYDANHLQWRVWATVHYWLFIKWQLINAMSFTERRNDKKKRKEWFLERFASLQWYRVAHWANKLFDTFISEYNPDYVISYSDITKHTWWLYDALWFVLENWNTRPSYRWVEYKTNTPYRRRSCNKKNMHNLPWFDPIVRYEWNEDDPYWQRTEEDLMEEHWYVKVCDAWNRKHVWYNKN